MKKQGYVPHETRYNEMQISNAFSIVKVILFYSYVVH